MPGERRSRDAIRAAQLRSYKAVRDEKVVRFRRAVLADAPGRPALLGAV